MGTEMWPKKELKRSEIKPEIKEMSEKDKEKIDQIFVGEGIGTIEGLKSNVPEIEKLLKEKNDKEIKEATMAKARDKSFLEKLTGRGSQYLRMFLLGVMILTGSSEFALAREKKEVVQDITKIENIIKETGKKGTTSLLGTPLETFRKSKNGTNVESNKLYFKILKVSKRKDGIVTQIFFDLEKDGKLDRMVYIPGEVNESARTSAEADALSSIDGLKKAIAVADLEKMTMEGKGPMGERQIIFLGGKEPIFFNFEKAEISKGSPEFKGKAQALYETVVVETLGKFSK